MSAKIILFSKNPVQINKKMIFAHKCCWKLQVLMNSSSSVGGSFHELESTWISLWSINHLFFPFKCHTGKQKWLVTDQLMFRMGHWVDSSFLVEVASGLYCCTTKPHICNLGLKSQFQNCAGNLKRRAVLTFSSEPCPLKDGKGWLSHLDQEVIFHKEALKKERTVLTWVTIGFVLRQNAHY